MAADTPLREILRELIRASGLVRRIGVNLNQAVAKLNATGQRSGDLCFHEVFMAPPDEVELDPPRQFQLLLAPPRWGGNLLQLPWQSLFRRCQRPIQVGPELLRRRSWWGRKNFGQWGRNKFAESGDLVPYAAESLRRAERLDAVAEEARKVLR